MSTLTKPMRDALRLLERGTLGRAGTGWIGEGGAYVAHPTVKGLERKGLISFEWQGTSKRAHISALGRSAIALPVLSA